MKQVCSFGDLNYSDDINRAWKNIKEIIKISATESIGLYGLNKFKPWFDEEYLRVLDQSMIKSSGYRIQTKTTQIT
jgi:hypothetical protein